MLGNSSKYWREWRLGVVMWLIGVGLCFGYLQAWPEKTGVNTFLMAMSAVVGLYAMVDPFVHPWLIRRGLRQP